MLNKVSSGIGPRFEQLGYDHLRWIDPYSAYGLREVPARTIDLKLSHGGWYIDAWQDLAVAGIVLRLPARRGEARFVAGMRDPWNTGSALVDLGRVHQRPERALSRADELARRYAEASCEDDARDTAEQAIAESQESIAKARVAFAELHLECRALRTSGLATALQPDCAAIRAAIQERLQTLRRSVATHVRWIRTLRADFWAVQDPARAPRGTRTVGEYR